MWVAVTVTVAGAGAVTETVAVVGIQALPAWAEAVSGMGQAPPDKIPMPEIAAALWGIRQQTETAHLAQATGPQSATP